MEEMDRSVRRLGGFPDPHVGYMERDCRANKPQMSRPVIVCQERGSLTGALRIAGTAILIAGVVAFVTSIAIWVDYLTGAFGGAVLALIGSMSYPTGVVLGQGVLWGPLLMVIGFGLRYGPRDGRNGP